MWFRWSSKSNVNDDALSDRCAAIKRDGQQCTWKVKFRSSGSCWRPAHIRQLRKQQSAENAVKTEKKSVKESAEVAICIAIKKNGTRCTYKAKANGVCGTKSHIAQITIKVEPTPLSLPSRRAEDLLLEALQESVKKRACNGRSFLFVDPRSFTLTAVNVRGSGSDNVTEVHQNACRAALKKLQDLPAGLHPKSADRYKTDPQGLSVGELRILLDVQRQQVGGCAFRPGSCESKNSAAKLVNGHMDIVIHDRAHSRVELSLTHDALGRRMHWLLRICTSCNTTNSMHTRNYYAVTSPTAVLVPVLCMGEPKCICLEKKQATIVY